MGRPENKRVHPDRRDREAGPPRGLWERRRSVERRMMQVGEATYEEYTAWMRMRYR
jgi:hypothetical protein